MINLNEIDKNDYKFISHIPEELIDEKRLQNFFIAREEEKKKVVFVSCAKKKKNEEKKNEIQIFYLHF